MKRNHGTLFRDHGFERIECQFCGRTMRESSLAITAHARTHVRDGDATERRSVTEGETGRLIFDLSKLGIAKREGTMRRDFPHLLSGAK